MRAYTLTSKYYVFEINNFNFASEKKKKKLSGLNNVIKS